MSEWQSRAVIGALIGYFVVGPLLAFAGYLIWKALA